MSMTDPIADMLTRVRNAIRIGREFADMPFSKEKMAIANVLKREGYITDCTEEHEGPQGTIRIYFKYARTGDPVISSIRRISKPSQRVYQGVREIRRVLDGLGIAIVSTPKGVLSDREARQQGVGGEVLCEVW